MHSPRRLKAVPGLFQLLHILRREPLEGVHFVVEPQISDASSILVYYSIPLLADVVQLKVGIYI